MSDFCMAPWPQYDEEQVEAASAVLRSGKVNYWTGEEGRQFEREYADYLGRKFAVAVANGTLALELALEAFGIGAGDEVVVPARTYVASASCAVMRGAVPVIADVDRDSQLITAESIAAVLTPRTRAVVVVHLAGWPCEMDEIMALAAQRNLIVIEDCAQAHGAFYKGRPVGSLGHAGAFSFCQDKIMTTGGEGGLLALDDETAWRRAWAYKDIGRSYEAVFEREHAPGFRWLTESFGTNWRLTEMQSALGRIQLRRLPQWRAQRAANAAVLIESLSQLPVFRIPQPAAHCEHAWYKFYLFVERDCLAPGWSRDRLMAEIEAAGVPCSVGSCSEIYLEKAFTDRAWGPEAPLPGARELGETSLCLLLHPTLDSTAMHEMAQRVSSIARQSMR
ncbi:DegT/DnrJ/EryC1/StrS aminotransferase family protein [Viridibacterium curvum]|uniref:DegT/DnrJ/EryC1/StrS aminotransferase family protein n=1 Tax=Viridibacterium curvum TaxID=1101404 RepID=A0ABP9QLK0_9RHOO